MSERGGRRGLLTPFNVVSAFILLTGLPVIAYRFVYGLGAATNLSQTNPWGLWIALDVLSGVALAAGGYTIASTVYIFGLKQYYPILRPAVLTGFLGYFFVVIGLLADLGRPWRLPYPLLMPYGVTSAMFCVAWAEFLYVFVQFLLFVPAVFEWLGWKSFRSFAAKTALGMSILGAIVSTIHQSALGSLFLIAPTKLHPLWYSPFLPILFFVSSLAAGCTMVIFEGMLCHKVFHDKIDAHHHAEFDRITIGLGKAGALVLFTYFFLKLLALADGGNWDLLWTRMGRWYMVEMLGFTLLPCLLLASGARAASPKQVRFGAGLAVLGIVVNRINTSVVAFNWHIPHRSVPSWMEIMTSLCLITFGVVLFRWIVNRMPVLSSPVSERRAQ